MRNRLAPVRRVLITTFDTRGLGDLISGLMEMCPDLHILSTGPTFDFIKALLGPQAANHLQSVEDFTGQVAVEKGVPRTLDWRLAIGILFDENLHSPLVDKYGVLPIDAVVCNLQPFGLAIARTEGTVEAARQLVETERPNLIRQAVRALHRVSVLTSPGQYQSFLRVLKLHNGHTDIAERTQLAIQAMSRLSRIDNDIATYLLSSLRSNREEALKDYEEVLAFEDVTTGTDSELLSEFEALANENPESLSDGAETFGGDEPVDPDTL